MNKELNNTLTEENKEARDNDIRNIARTMKTIQENMKWNKLCALEDKLDRIEDKLDYLIKKVSDNDAKKNNN